MEEKRQTSFQIIPFHKSEHLKKKPSPDAPAPATPFPCSDGDCPHGGAATLHPPPGSRQCPALRCTDSAPPLARLALLPALPVTLRPVPYTPPVPAALDLSLPNLSLRSAGLLRRQPPQGDLSQDVPSNDPERTWTSSLSRRHHLLDIFTRLSHKHHKFNFPKQPISSTFPNLFPRHGLITSETKR